MRRSIILLSALGCALMVLSGQISDMGSGYSRGNASVGGTNTWAGEQTYRDTIELRHTAPLSGTGKIVIDPRDTPLWAAATTYAVGAVVQPTTLNQVFDYGTVNSNSYTYGLFECTAITTGISAGSEPAWGTVGTTVVDGGVTWTRRGGQRRVFEIWDVSSAGRSLNVPVAWFDAMGQFKSYRSISLGGTSNAMTGEDFTLWPAMVPGSGTFGGAWFNATADGNNQVGFAWNSHSSSSGWPFQLVNGTQLIPASQTELFAIGKDGGLFWTGTVAGHACNITEPDTDTGYGVIVEGDPASKCLYQGVGSNSAAGQINGATPGEEQTVGRGVYQKNAMTDNTATDVARITIPNVEASALLKVTILGRASDGESTRGAEGLIVFNRRAAGVNVVATAAVLEMLAEAVDTTNIITLAYSLQDNGEAAGATQTFDLQLTINTLNGATADATVLLEFLNHQTGGATIAPL